MERLWRRSRFDCAQKLISGIHHSAQISWTSADSIQGFFNFCLTVTIIKSKYSLVRRTPYNGGVQSILKQISRRYKSVTLNFVCRRYARENKSQFTKPLTCNQWQGSKGIRCKAQENTYLACTGRIKMVEHGRDKQEARLQTNARNTDAKRANTSSSKQRNDKEVLHRTEHSWSKFCNTVLSNWK